MEIQKKRNIIPPHDFKFLLAICILLAVGVINRPTFLLYAFAPLLLWFPQGVSNKSIFSPFQIFNIRIAALIIVSSSVLLLTDSLYYGQLTRKKLWDLIMSFNDWKLVPFNFVMYNIVPGNLATHDVHAMVNQPLLFGPLAPIFLVSIILWTTDVVFLPWMQKPGVRTVYSLTPLFGSPARSGAIPGAGTSNFCGCV